MARPRGPSHPLDPPPARTVTVRCAECPAERTIYAGEAPVRSGRAWKRIGGKWRCPVHAAALQTLMAADGPRPEVSFA